MDENKSELVTTIPKPMMASEDGTLVGSTLEEQYRLAKYYAKSGMLPKGYDTPEKALIGFQYARELGLKPLTAMKNICVINGQPNLWGDLPLALARKSGQLESIDEYFIEKDYKRISLKNKNLHAVKWAAVCVIKRVGIELKDFSWTMDDVNKSNRGPVWAKYPQIMWKRKVRSIALKDIFGDVLGTFDIAEYNHSRSPDVPESMIDVTPQDKIDDLKESLKGDEKEITIKGKPPVDSIEPSTPETVETVTNKPASNEVEKTEVPKKESEVQKKLREQIQKNQKAKASKK